MIPCMRGVFMLVLVVLMLGGAGCGASGRDGIGAEADEFPNVSTRESVVAPNFALERLDQRGKLELASLRGKAVVLYVWASWCGPCKVEAPYLQRIWQQNRRRGLVVVGLDAKDFRADARRFARRYKLSFPLVYDGPGIVVDAYGVTGFPATFVIDRDGKIVARFTGAISATSERAARLRSAIQAALG
jgi:peroxiredoxin